MENKDTTPEGEMSLEDQLEATRTALVALRKTTKTSKRVAWAAAIAVIGVAAIGGWEVYNEEQEDDQQQEQTDQNFLEGCERNNDQLQDRNDGYSDPIEGIIAAFPDADAEIINGLRQGVDTAQSRTELRDCEQELQQRRDERAESTDRSQG